MSEPAKVRLVRCPKCEKLLPEVTGFSVYQCGGCGAVLRAKNKDGDLDNFSEKSDEGKVGLGVDSEKLSEKIEYSSHTEKRMTNLSDGSESDVRSNASSSGRPHSRRTVHDRGERDKTTNTMNNGGMWAVDNRVEMEKNIDEIIRHSEMEKDFEDLKLQSGSQDGSRRIADSRVEERSEMEGFWRAQRFDPGRNKYSNSNFSNEGPSYAYGEPSNYRRDMDRSNKAEYNGDDRAELLRKLDELKDQLSRSGDLFDKRNDKVPLDRKMVHEDPYGGSENWYSDGPMGVNSIPLQYPVRDKYVAGPSYTNPYAEPPPFMNRHGMAGHSFYPAQHPPPHSSSQFQGLDDPVRSRITSRGPYQAPDPFDRHQSHAYFPGQYMDNNMIHKDPYKTYPPNVNHHHPSCSCIHCYEKFQVRPPIQPAVAGDKRFLDVTNDPLFCHQENPSMLGPRSCISRTSATPPLYSHNPQLHGRWPNDVNSDVGHPVRRRPPREQFNGGGRRCHPAAGGAPFLTCYNCFELLQLPKKVFLNNRSHRKMRCGGCSTVLGVTIADGKLVVSVLAEMEHNDDHNMTSNGNGLNTLHGHRNMESVNFSSNDYDHSGYEFLSMDREVPPSMGHGSSVKSAEMRSHRSTSSCTSEEEDNLDTVTSGRKISTSAELPIKSKTTPPPAGAPLEDHFDYSNKYHRPNRYGNGNRSGRSDQGKVIMLNKTTSRPNSMKDASSATEIEISSNEYANTGTSTDSGPNGMAESFFAGIIKKSFRDRKSKSSHSDDQEKANVTVNGHLIPDRLIKKAEKLAGPIHPGHYWYDFRAGFWGAIGGPCLGIIPPFIEEFNYPMPENCAGGNTGIFVNGRHLHQKDLNLLGSRGLPTDRDRSYIIEISGRVLDEDTGEELESLGKLAPTVEKVKHGFGMKPPRQLHN